jgi:hypothetical protein
MRIEALKTGQLQKSAGDNNNMIQLSFVGSPEGLMEYLEQEANLSTCCGAQSENGRCLDCGDNFK